MFTVQPYIGPNPIQRLCPDILAEIFTLCIYDVPKESWWPVQRISNRTALILLCSICSSWRSLAISTPRLWQKLDFDSDDRMFSMDTKSFTSGVRTFLDRSRTLPLSIRAIFWPMRPESDKATKCRLILEVLSQEVSRWESFELHEGLYTLDILSIGGIHFTEAPRLKILAIPCLDPTFVSGIPWDQLVQITIANVQTVSMVLEVIQSCPRLESLSLQVEEGNKETDEDGSLTFRSITRHDTLRRLHLRMLPYINAVTDRLALPALTDLSLQRARRSMSGVEANFCCSQLVAFFTRSNCELEEFALDRSKLGPGELLECLSHRSCQTLTRLLIQGDNSNESPPIVDRKLLIRLTYSDVDDDVPLCPKLAHLELYGCYCSDRSSSDLLGRMIQSRCFGHARGAQLRSLRLHARSLLRGRSRPAGICPE